MSAKSIVFAALCALLLAANNVWAEWVDDLYVAQTPVPDRSQSARDVASRDALAQVIVKVSGSLSIVEDPRLRDSLAQAPDFVQQYSYVEVEDGLAARFEFDASLLSAALSEAGVPMWTANRPAVILWLVVQDVYGRQFINSDSYPELAQAVQESFARRGVPVVLPLFDLADSASVTADDVWRLSAPVVAGASARYNAQNQLMGRLAPLQSSGT